MLEFTYSKLFWITVVLAAVYAYLKYYLYNYWNRYNVPNETPSIPLGNVSIDYLRGKIHFAGFIDSIYNKFKHHRFYGVYVFQRPILCINDPELIKLILVKDFDLFADRGWFYDGKVDPMSSHLFLLPSEKWKRLRIKFSPIFTSGKLRRMYPYLVEISKHMIKTCDAELKTTDIVDVNDMLARYTTDIISSIVYGLDSKSLDNPKSEFQTKGEKALNFGRFNLLMAMFAPEMMSWATVPLFQENVSKFFLNIFIEAVTYRRKEKIQKKDFLDLIMQLIDYGKVEDDDQIMQTNGKNSEHFNKLTIEEAAANAFVFFLGGYETSSSTTSFCLYELAQNPEIQEKLQAEIDEVVKSPTGLTYESIAEMEYLDMVLSETLRKHPSLPILNRIAKEDYPLPTTDFVIKKDMRIMISLSGIQNNPEYYPDPEKFDPLRFTKEKAVARNKYINIPFGDGERMCIGKRFAVMQVKIALAAMLHNYQFSISEKTQVPPQYETMNFTQTVRNGVKLRVKRRDLEKILRKRS
ncbi:cytochrome P450 6CK7 [Nasonia vitripennis]|uniref:Cytochrome P450 n=1 Tax=Nasonia vitripennis TaxID=7425 RepID=A0A7M6UFW7_NASVI|nr:cytochrome P450 6CK7 [Nasonia vitripennis]